MLDTAKCVNGVARSYLADNYMAV